MAEEFKFVYGLIVFFFTFTVVYSMVIYNAYSSTNDYEAKVKEIQDSGFLGKITNGFSLFTSMFSYGASEIPYWINLIIFIPLIMIGIYIIILIAKDLVPFT